MSDNWTAVAVAIRARVDELAVTQKDLATKSGVSESTIRQLMNNYGPRRRARHTLEDISRGLQWPANHLARVLDEDQAGAAPDERQAEVAELRDQLAALADRVAALERSSHAHQ
jgi:hypothetical protein